MQPNHPHPPMFPTQSVLNSYPARTRSESRLRSSLHTILRTLYSLQTKTLTPSNGTQSCYAVDVAQHDLCRNPVAAQKEKHLRDGIMVEQLEHAYIYRHTYTYMYGVLRPYIRKVPDVRPRSTKIMSGALQISQLSDKGREPKGWSWSYVELIWAQRHAFAVILGYSSIIHGETNAKNTVTKVIWNTVKAINDLTVRPKSLVWSGINPCIP